MNGLLKLSTGEFILRTVETVVLMSAICIAAIQQYQLVVSTSQRSVSHKERGGKRAVRPAVTYPAYAEVPA